MQKFRELAEAVLVVTLLLALSTFALSMALIAAHQVWVLYFTP